MHFSAEPKLTRMFNLEDQPNQTWPKSGPWGTNLNQNYVQIGFIKYIFGMKPNLNPFPTQPDLFQPDPEAPTWPKF